MACNALFCNLRAAVIEITKLTISVGQFALKDVSFQVPTGQYAVLMGRTGCGKTTILEAICGLRSVDGGRIVLDGRDVTRLKPAERNIGYVPQDGALFNSMTIRDHLAFSLRVRKAERSLIGSRVAEMASLLGIEHLLHRKPQGLSGGEAQRVSLGRALASHPSILCMDEPMSALDGETRDQMYELLESIQRRVQVTTLHITHSSAEADRLGDCLLRLTDGRIHEIPREERS